MKYLNEEGLIELIGLIKAALNGKENLIEDLDLIRLGARLGATSLQEHQDISHLAEKAATLEGYGILDAYTKEEIDSKVSSVFTYKGSVETLDALPATADVGDVYEVVSEQANYSWNGTEWTVLGSVVDISGKADKGTTLEDYGIEDSYTKFDLSAIINDNNPIIEDKKSYITKGNTAFYNYQEASVNLYSMERTAEGWRATSAIGASGLFITNNTEDEMVIVIMVRNYNGYTRGAYKYGHASPDDSPASIIYKMAGNNAVDLGTGVVTEPIAFPLTIPAGRKGYFINTAYTPESTVEGPLEITESYSNTIFGVSDDFQGMTIKTEALLPTPVILTQEEYDAIEPKKNTCLYFIVEE